MTPRPDPPQPIRVDGRWYGLVIALALLALVALVVASR